jgi:hypothetical protein
MIFKNYEHISHKRPQCPQSFRDYGIRKGRWVKFLCLADEPAPVTVRALRGSAARISREDPIGEFLHSVLEALGAGEEYVEARILKTRTEVRLALAEELKGAPLSSGLAVPDFVTFHESFAGYPRIWLSEEEFDIEDPVSRARLEHEAGHAVLHGEISSYMVPASPPLFELSQRGRMSHGEASLASYLLLIGIKDYQVSCLLAGTSFEEDQVALYQRELSEPLRAGNIIDAVAEMKVLLAAWPFRQRQTISNLLQGALGGLGAYRKLAQGIIYDLQENQGVELHSLLETASRRVAEMMAGGCLGSEC